MIFDALSYLHNYLPCHRLFPKVLDFINSHNLSDIEIGKVDIGEGVYVVISEYATDDISNKFIPTLQNRGLQAADGVGRDSAPQGREEKEPRASARVGSIECHKKYIDIQIIIDGVEQAGICDKNECKIIEEYNQEKDLEKLEGKVDLITLKKGCFVIFFPQDGHAPGLKVGNSENRVKKAVFKVPL